MRKADVYLLFVAVALLAVILGLVHARHRAEQDLSRLRQLAAVVQHLGLTDLCLATDARYTRHSSQADGHSAFQSHPLALDHFPSGSLIRPPDRLRHVPASLD